MEYLYRMSVKEKHGIFILDECKVYCLIHDS